MRLWLLGTGTPTPSTRRVCSGYLVQTDNAYLVFDHGFGAHQRLLEIGFSPRRRSHTRSSVTITTTTSATIRASC
jgi:ribonuclease BN (tRNA processing enzyme)